MLMQEEKEVVFMERKILTVSQINHYVKQLFAYDALLNNVWLRGEISNLKKHSSGHYYLTLKDDQGGIASVMFRGSASKLAFRPEEGMGVLVKGYVSLYEKTGQYQFYINEMEPDGQGALFMAFEQLKKRLEQEGLFDSSLKKPIPNYPKTVGIVTSGTGAAIKDIVRVASRRNPNVQLYLIPSLVQGQDAGASIAKAIHRFNEEQPVDVLIVGRGGGSIEDLWAFNEEIVARAISESAIPVISAVGHESDFTIADFVADMRAATPSAAAELAVPSLAEMEEQVDTLMRRLQRGSLSVLQAKREQLQFYANHPAFRNPTHTVNQYRQTVDHLTYRLKEKSNQMVKEHRMTVQHLDEQLKLLSPTHNLKRGYGLVFGEEESHISSIEQVEEGQPIKIQLQDGYIYATVQKKEVHKGE